MSVAEASWLCGEMEFLSFCCKIPVAMKRQRALGLLFLFMGLANLARAALVPLVSPVLEGWPLSVSLPWLGGLYLVWGLAFTAAGWLTYKGKTSVWALPLAVGYQGMMWAVRLLTYRAVYVRDLWARDLVLSALFLGLVAFLTRKRKGIDGNAAEGLQEREDL